MFFPFFQAVCAWVVPVLVFAKAHLQLCN